MRKQAKRFWHLALLATMALVPAACGDSEKKDDDLPPPIPGGDGDGDVGDGDVGDGDGDAIVADAGPDGAVPDPCPKPTTSLQFLNQCSRDSIQRVKFDNATRVPAGPLPPL